MTGTITVPDLQTGTWVIDPVHSEIGFTVRHLMTKVRGLFRQFEGVVVIPDDPTASTVEVTVNLESVDTGNEQRDGHLRTNDFLDIEHHPTMTFRSTGLRPSGEGFVLSGDLTIRGVTRPVDLDAEFLGVDTDPYGQTKAGFEATTTLNRKDFKVEGNVPLNGERFLIGDQVAVQVAAQFVLQS